MEEQDREEKNTTRKYQKISGNDFIVRNDYTNEDCETDIQARNIEKIIDENTSQSSYTIDDQEHKDVAIDQLRRIDCVINECIDSYLETGYQEGVFDEHISRLHLETSHSNMTCRMDNLYPNSIKINENCNSGLEFFKHAVDVSAPERRGIKRTYSDENVVIIEDTQYYREKFVQNGNPCHNIFPKMNVGPLEAVVLREKFFFICNIAGCKLVVSEKKSILDHINLFHGILELNWLCSMCKHDIIPRIYGPLDLNLVVEHMITHLMLLVPATNQLYDKVDPVRIESSNKSNETLEKYNFENMVEDNETVTDQEATYILEVSTDDESDYRVITVYSEGDESGISDEISQWDSFSENTVSTRSDDVLNRDDTDEYTVSTNSDEMQQSTSFEDTLSSLTDITPQLSDSSGNKELETDRSDGGMVPAPPVLMSQRDHRDDATVPEKDMFNKVPTLSKYQEGAVSGNNTSSMHYGNNELDKALCVARMEYLSKAEMPSENTSPADGHILEQNGLDTAKVPMISEGEDSLGGDTVLEYSNEISHRYKPVKNTRSVDSDELSKRDESEKNVVSAPSVEVSDGTIPNSNILPEHSDEISIEIVLANNTVRVSTSVEVEEIEFLSFAH